MTKSKYEKLKKEWNELIKKFTTDSYKFFIQPENDLQAKIQLLLKYQKEGNSNDYDELASDFFNKKDLWGFCGEDLSQLDLSMMSADSLARITFDTNTKWPPKNKLPKGFNPKEILEKAKTFKGLGIEDLHKQGITGKGVKVAYLDKGFDTEHEEFENGKIEYINYQEDEKYDFHGYAVVSRLLGKNIGISPDVDLLYFNCDGEGQKYALSTFKHEIRALEKILARLKKGEQIVAVGVSGPIRGHIYMALERGEVSQNVCETLVQKYDALFKQLKEYGCQMISSKEFLGYGFDFAHKVNPLVDNYDLDNYVQYTNGKVCVIESDKVIPVAYTKDGYQHENMIGCGSWSIPQVVGLYCLAKQVNPKITFEEFVEISQRTAKEPNANGFRLIDAVALIKEAKLLKEETENSSMVQGQK